MPEVSQLTELMKRSFFEMMKDVGTSIVGHVLAFDPDTQLAQVQIGIQRKDINGKVFDPPPLIEVPVYFQGGDYFIEHQVDAGTEGIIIFSQRCIDGWVNTGGIAENPIMRFHDVSDAVFLCGIRSQPNKISDHQNNGVRIRNKTGDQFIWLKNDNTAEINIPTLYINGNIIHAGNTTQTGNVTLTGNTTQTGALGVSISVTAPNVIGSTDVTAGGISGNSHTHTVPNPLHLAPITPVASGTPT